MELRQCKSCRETKPITEFYKRQQDPPLYKSQCKACLNAKVMAYQRTNAGKEVRKKAFKKWRDGNLEFAKKISRESNRRGRAEDPRRFKSYELKARYGISLEEYEAILATQGGKCAICNAQEPRGRGMFHVDHCHDTSNIRGLLCIDCNLGIGKLKDSADLTARATKYLTVSSSKG